jgi:hypothetical protein
MGSRPASQPGPSKFQGLLGGRLMPELSWGVRVHAGGRRKPTKPVSEPGDKTSTAEAAASPLSLSDEQLAVVKDAAEPIAADQRGAFLRLVANSLRGKVVSGASVRSACAEAQKLCLSVATGSGGKSKYG